MPTISAAIDLELDSLIESEATNSNLSKSDIIRKLIKEGIQRKMNPPVETVSQHAPAINQNNQSAQPQQDQPQPVQIVQLAEPVKAEPIKEPIKESKSKPEENHEEKYNEKPKSKGLSQWQVEEIFREKIKLMDKDNEIEKYKKEIKNKMLEMKKENEELEENNRQLRLQNETLNKQAEELNQQLLFSERRQEKKEKEKCGSCPTVLKYKSESEQSKSELEKLKDFYEGQMEQILDYVHINPEKLLVKNI